MGCGHLFLRWHVPSSLCCFIHISQAVFILGHVERTFMWLWCLRYWRCLLPLILLLFEISISLQSFEVWTFRYRNRRLIILILIFELFVGLVDVSLELTAETVKTIEKILGIMCDWTVAISRICSWFSLRHWFPTLYWVIVGHPFFLIMLDRIICLSSVVWNIHAVIRIIVICKLVRKRVTVYGTHRVIPLIIRLVFFNLGIINDFLIIFDSCDLSFVIGGILLFALIHHATRVIIIVVYWFHILLGSIRSLWLVYIWVKTIIHLQLYQLWCCDIFQPLNEKAVFTRLEKKLKDHRKHTSLIRIRRPYRLKMLLISLDFGLRHYILTFLELFHQNWFLLVI